MRYWINTVSREHVHRGVAGGFTQAGHGKASPLQRLRRGDLIAFYSPRTALDSGEPLKAFTASGRITDDEPYQVVMAPDFHPWRRNVEFFPAQEAPIQPLIAKLEFIKNKQSWGMYFRRGLFAVTAADFALIAAAMHTSIDLDLA
jgi:hypothetical protein